MKTPCVCVHGHFYQPPRETPWLEEIEEQPSAWPFHDWNERIYGECYRANAYARWLDAHGKIVDIVNNYAAMSFNFGPTLLSWLERKHPRAYQRILQADRESLASRGHGNALAQVYNHMILPLAHPRDQATQVKWGLADFRFRFGREAEAMWLPETACRDETLEVLIEHQMRFVILSPYQAQAIRPLGGGERQDVSQGQMDPKQPYRYLSKKIPGKFIEVFFYDGPISKAIGFEEVLSDAKILRYRIDAAKISGSHDPQLIHAATDGETYGHHKVFGDRALAYFFDVEAPQHGYEIVNYSQYLDRVSPHFEVVLKAGEDGEGTSWSCAHGVKRWKEHCGCRTGGPAEWTQHWRKPLRESLDWLRDELVKVYETEAGKYLHDAWKARDEYIEIILNRSEDNLRSFFSRHARAELQKGDRVVCLKLLEMQRHAMLMYTSCGWFFNDLSGIETVQILAYAARALELAFEITPRSLEEEFLKRLSHAKSNLTEFKDGRGVYEKCVTPQRIQFEGLTALYAIRDTLDHLFDSEGAQPLYGFSIQPVHKRRESYGNVTLNFGRIRMTSQITREEQELVFMVVQIAQYDFRCSVKRHEEMQETETVEKDFFDSLHVLDLVGLLRKMDARFGQKYFTLNDLPLEDRKKIITLLTREAVQAIGTVHENLYEEHHRMREIYRSMHLAIPKEMHYAAEYTLSKKLVKAVRELAEHQYNLKKARAVFRIIEDAQAFGVQLLKDDLKNILQSEFDLWIEDLAGEGRTQGISIGQNLLRLAKRIGIEMDLRRAQEAVLDLLKQGVSAAESGKSLSAETWEDLLRLGEELGIQVSGFRKRFHPAPSQALPEGGSAA